MSKPLKPVKALVGIFLCLCWNISPAVAGIIIADSASYEHVSAAVSRAQSGDTVQIPSGNATWSSALDVGSKSINIIGAGSGSTILNGSTFFRWKNTGNNPVRVSGIRFNSADQVPFSIGLRGPIYKFRADHCIFNKGDSSIGTNWYTEPGAGPVYGVVDHCTFFNMKRAYYAMDCRTNDASIPTELTPSNYDGAAAWAEFLANPSSFPGSEKMMYFEDNNFIFDANITDPNIQGVLYGTYGGKCCFRYNTCTGSDSYVDAHGDYPSNSTIYYEIYNNTFVHGDFGGAQGLVQWQRGGQWIVHDNTFTNTTLPMKMSVYWVLDTVGHRVKNTYVWGNSLNGNTNQSAIAIVGDSGQTPPGYSAANIRLNQEYFLHAPTSGQAYFPYAPLVHPHPLVTGGGGPPPPPPSPSPTPPILGLTFDASAGVITTPFAVTANAVSQPIQTTDPTQGGRAAYTFAVSTAGDYLISATVNCPDVSSNSLFVNIDAEPSSLMTWNIPVTAGSETRVASWPPNTTQKAWTLTAGTHQLIFRGREANAVLQHITLGTAPAPPQGLHVP